MSYRCEVCDWKVPAGRPCLRWQELRTEPEGKILAGTILREVKVCERCHRRLHGGKGLGDLIQEAIGKARREALPPPVEEAADIFADPLKRLGS